MTQLTLRSDEPVFYTPQWAEPLRDCPDPMLGAKGGRGSGKSHYFAEKAVLQAADNPDWQLVCIREIQKSLKFSAKKLIEQKIKKFGLSDLFKITLTEIRHRHGDGIIIFQGMQDHTADSIKSLEGFDVAWVEEGQSISNRSLELLIPTIRKDGSQIWFSWNPDQPDDPVEQYLDEMTCVHVNYMDNPFCTQKLKDDAARHLIRSPETYDHVWLGGYNILSDAQVFKGKWRVEEFDTHESWMPLYGLDFGFSQDPTAGVKMYLENEVLYIKACCGKVGLDLDVTGDYLVQRLDDIERHTVRADSSRPESISYLKRHGLPLVRGVKKWAGSVEDGIDFMKSLKDIVIDPSCRSVIDEFRLYSYKIDKRTGDITRVIVDDHNHYIDAIRYALQPFISKKGVPKVRSL